jgi:hypothetical protein
MCGYSTLIHLAATTTSVVGEKGGVTKKTGSQTSEKTKQQKKY